MFSVLILFLYLAKICTDLISRLFFNTYTTKNLDRTMISHQNLEFKVQVIR
jgi:hypothetical protein